MSSRFNFSNVRNTIAISKWFGDNSIALFTYPVEEQKTYLRKLGEAKNDFDRSYKQYLCQRKFQRRYRVVLLDLLFYFVYPIVLLYYWMKRIKMQIGNYEYDAIAAPGLTELLPDELLKRYKISEKLYYTRGGLNWKDVLFSLKLFFRYPLCPLFVTKITLKMAYYSYMIRAFNPKAIIVMNEYSYTSSILTLFCEMNGVLHINALHGEKLFYIRDAYFRYHECWIWDEHYKRMFIDLKADPNQFKIAIPQSLRIDCEKYKNTRVFADYKYYLAKYTEENIILLVKAMRFVKEGGRTLKYRPHPLWSDLELLRKYVDEKEIEMPNEVSILESVANMNFAVGSFSTVLYQAYCSGKEVILDDVAFASEYKKLEELEYVLCKKGLPRLSDSILK